MTEHALNQRYQAIVMYEQRIITVKNAAQATGVSERQFYRILQRFQERGGTIQSLCYLSHQAWNKTEPDKEEEVLVLSRDNPEALNSHLSWLFWDAHGTEIQSSTIRNILIRNKAYIPFAKKRERAYKKFQTTHFGALAQLDTADGYWLKGYPMLHLILAVDDATRTPLAGGIFEHDSTLNNMLVIKEIIGKYGVPALFYTDNDSKFKVIRHGKSRYQSYTQETLAGQTETEIRRALQEVGSGLITHAPFHPQGKGKIEKFLRFAQECYLGNHKAKTLIQLNEGFRRWLAWYDQRGHRGLGESAKAARAKLVAQGKVAFRPVPKGVNLDSVFAVKEERKPNKYNIFSYHGNQYQLPLDKVQYPGKVELRILPDETIRVFNKEQELIAELRG